jgi:hypothetical protein
MRAFLNKDAEEVSKILGRKVRIDPERMPEYLDIMQDLAQDCVEFCLNKFREDLHIYQQNRPVTPFTDNQKKRANKLVKKSTFKTKLETILEEGDEKSNNNNDKPSTPLLKKSSTASLSESTDSSPEQKEEKSSHWQDVIVKRSVTSSSNEYKSKF